MSAKENESGFAARLLHCARELIWQDDPAARKPASAGAVSPNEKSSGAALQGRPVLPAHNEMTAELLALVMNRPTAYSALAEAIAALSEIAMDDGTRYRSAFAVLKKTQQRTVEQIAQAIDVHLSVLESERLRFAAQSKNAEDGEITARTNEIGALHAAIEQGEKEIAKLRADTDAHIRQLQDEMTDKQARAAELSRETEQKRNAIARTTQNFDAASLAVKDKLSEEKARIQQYLG